MLCLVFFSWCDCEMSGHSGSLCEFGPDCSPYSDPAVNPCANNAQCEYTDVHAVRCLCPPNLTGDRCDTWRLGAIPNCSSLDCSDNCAVTPDGHARCECFSGRKLNVDGRSCSAIVTREVAVEPPLACRYLLKGPRGLITTPNFPQAFRTPINCEWVLDVGRGRDTVIYFSEIYLADPAFVSVWSYETYRFAEGVGTGERPVVPTDSRNNRFDFNEYSDW